MADPTNPRDSKYASDPEHYVFVGGRWQYRESKASGEAPPAVTGHVQGSTVGPTPGDPADDVFGDPFAKANKVLTTAGLADINNFAGYQKFAQQYRDGAVRRAAQNPYNAGMANASLPAQLALLQQMKAQQAGPSIAAMQGQRAMAQGGQQALQAAAMGQGRGAMLAAQQGGAGMAGDLGQARLSEIMKSQAGMGSMAGQARGGYLGVAEKQQQSGLAAQALADQLSNTYASVGNTLDQGRAQAALDDKKARDAKALEIYQKQIGAGKEIANGTINGIKIAAAGA